MAIVRTQARSSIDLRPKQIGAHVMAVPSKGWIRAIRDALRMSSRELGNRMSLSQQAVADLERSEQRGAIRIESLRRVADALDCDLVYYLRPRRSLEEMVRTQARRKAAAHLGRVAHHGTIEDQSVTGVAAGNQLADLTQQFIDRRGLWTEDASQQ